MNILIADDQSVFLKTYSILLKLENHQVYTSTTLEETFNTLQQHPIDMGIVDFDFDETWEEVRNGIDLIIKVRKRGISTPIIINTAFPGAAEESIGKLPEEEKTYLHHLRLSFKLTLENLLQAIKNTP